MSPEEKREREKMPFIVATYVYASSACTPLGPIKGIFKKTS
jgi:hypothetical protein